MLVTGLLVLFPQDINISQEILYLILRRVRHVPFDEVREEILVYSWLTDDVQQLLLRGLIEFRLLLAFQCLLQA